MVTVVVLRVKEAEVAELLVIAAEELGGADDAAAEDDAAADDAAVEAAPFQASTPETALRGGCEIGGG